MKNIKYVTFLKKNIKAPFREWGSPASRLQSHYEEAV